MFAFCVKQKTTNLLQHISADPFLQKGGAWEGVVFVLVLVMSIITTDAG